MLLEKADGVSCCDLAAEVSQFTPITKKTGTCHAERKPTAPISISPCQLERRNAYKALTTLWNTLSSGQKTAWDTLAQNTPFVNDCGETYYISAFNMFSKVNGVLLSFGASFMLSSAPGSYTPPGSALSYSSSYVDIPQSSYDPLALAHIHEPDRGFQILSFPKTELPAGYTTSYFRLLHSATEALVNYAPLDAGDNTVFSTVLDSTNTYIYAITNNTPALLVKIRTSDLTRVGSLTLAGNIYQARALVIDSSDTYIYVGLITSPGQVEKIRLSDFTSLGTLAFIAGENQIRGMCIDGADSYLYAGLNTSPGKIVKVRLSDFTRNAVLTLATGQNLPSALIVDSSDVYMYASTFTAPCITVKIRLSDFSNHASITFPTGEDHGESLALTSSDTFLYVGLTTTPGVIVKVNLSGFTRVAALSLLAFEFSVRDLSIDNADSFLYVAYSWSNTVIPIIRLSDFTRVGSIALLSGDAFSYTLSMDSTSNFLYAGMGNTPVRVDQINLQISDIPAGILHAWYHGFNKTQGRCAIIKYTDYEQTLDFGSTLPDGTFIVRTVNLLTGAYIEETFEAEPQQ